MSAVYIADSERWTVSSAAVGIDYVIDVNLPPGLDRHAGGHRVLYVLDGNATFPLVVATLRMLEMYREVEPLVVVGVGFPVDSAAMRDTMGHRTRDFTPTAHPAFWDHFLEHNPDGPGYLGSGGSGAFRTFLREELMPVVAERLPVDPKRAGLHGHSFGGLFALDTLFAEPDLFADYLVGSPSIWWDDHSLLRLAEEHLPSRSDLAARVVISVGADEPTMMLADAFAMEQSLRGRRYPSLDLRRTIVHAGETHKSCVPAFTTAAIRELYGVPLAPHEH